MFRHVLITVDGSAPATRAAKAGVAFARRIGAKVTVYHAVNPIARHRGCEPIFLGSHGHRGKRLLLGSVASEVLAHADIPVVVYR